MKRGINRWCFPADWPARRCLEVAAQAGFNGVEFNDIRTGGIEITSQAVRAGWKNVFYGKNNAGEPDTLFTVTPNPTNYR
jgi:hypothetical protein